MDALLFALNAVLPILLMMLLGYLMKHCGLVDAELAKALNKLVFHVFLPVMLFLNVYKIETLNKMEMGYILYVVAVTAAVFGISLLLVRWVTPKGESRGPLLQACFRSNYALIGVPLAESLFGDEGAAVATLLLAVFIPVSNGLAVVSLSMFRQGSEGTHIRKILLDILRNPLIQSVAAGFLALGLRALLVWAAIDYRLTDIKPVYRVLEYLSGLATPLALLALGAQFEFSAVISMRREIVFGTLMRTFVVPFLGVGVAWLAFRNVFGGAHFAAFVAVFATPVAVSSVPMTQEMGSDVILAGQLVVWTTMFSMLTTFFASFLLRLAGIFV